MEAFNTNSFWCGLPCTGVERTVRNMYRVYSTQIKMTADGIFQIFLVIHLIGLVVRIP